MFKKVLSLSIATGCLAITGSALAAPASGSTDHGFYVGGMLGYSSTDYTAKNQGVNSASIITSESGSSKQTITPISGKHHTSTDNDGLGGRLFAGYQLNKYFSVEGGYTQYNATEIDHLYGLSNNLNQNLKLNQNAIDLMGKISYPVSDKLVIFAKGGVAYVNADTVKSTPTLTGTVEDGALSSTNLAESSFGTPTETLHELRPSFGFGGSYYVTNSLSTDVSWTKIQGGKGIKDSSFTGIGLTYHAA